jgi:alpha-glucosidase
MSGLLRATWEFRLARSLANPPVFRLAEREGARLTLASDGVAVVHIFVLEADIIRVFVLPDGAPVMPRTWAIAPGADDVATEGRDRFDTAGFAAPDFTVEEADERLTVTTATLRLSVRLRGFFCRWEMATDAGWREIARDRPTQAYSFGWWDEPVRHHLVLKPGERFFGLGERSGAMDRAGRRLRLGNTDAMGYSAATSDPLYKHIPFYITLVGEPAAAFGLFYDTLADGVFDFGQELSNYHGRYRSFTAEDGDLDYYVIAGPAVGDVTRRFTWLTGRPALLPKWGLGYSGSTMSYTDAPDAQDQMAGFIEGCRTHDILCDSFHLSSGYTSIGPRRYVFHWNRDKFPDPAAFAESYRAAGLRLVANIKPCLLDDHPRFAEAQARGLLIADADGEPYRVQFWDGLGAYLDFTNPATLDWWKAHVAADLLDYGIAATWNDNNEFEIPSNTARAGMFGEGIAAKAAKPLQPLLMMRASREAQAKHAPDQRPFVVSRSGAAGMQRYAQTWSGDNATSWETLRYNIRMGLGLALSGVSNCGHDIGGFAGPAPDPELFVRWVQAGVFMPRFSIHSWNDDGTVNEPWMHPEATPAVRTLIALRYRLLPYLYDLAWRHHAAYEPIVRPTFLEFPDDPVCLEDNDELMLGPWLLTAPVVEPGAETRTLYLPAGAAWWNWWTGERFAGGQTITTPATWMEPVMFAREGAAIPLNIAEQHFDHRADTRGLALFPPGDDAFSASCYEDDGETASGAHGFWRIEVAATDSELTIGCWKDGPTPPLGDDLTLLLPASTAGSVRINRGRAISDTIEGIWRRIVVAT